MLIYILVYFAGVATVPAIVLGIAFYVRNVRV